MKKYRKVIQNQQFKTLGPTWKEEFELPEGSYLV